MTSPLRPFSGHIPTAEFAHRIVGPPVSMLSPDQRDVARMDNLSFRHVVGKRARSSHEAAQKWLHDVRDLGALTAVGPVVFVYRISKGNMTTTGIVADVSIADYNNGRIKKHEKTITKTVKKMVSYMRTTRIYGNPVALAYRPHAGLDDAIANHVQREPDYSFVALGGAAHALWAIEGEAAHELCKSFDDDLYITDGHHRMASASIVAAEEGRPNAHLPAAIFSSTELRLRAFARCVVDPDLDVEETIRQLKARFRLEPMREGAARPRNRFEFGLKIDGQHFVLHLDRTQIPDDLYKSLDVNLLQKLILEPVFGIKKPRKDKRLHFVPDSDHPQDELACEAWFLPYPASVEDVMTVADIGKTMPPKSTWFAPKIPSGLVIRLLKNSNEQ